MKFIGIVVSVVLLFAENVWANNCYMIQDADAKNECLAESENDSLYCYMIVDNDTKNYCLARIEEDNMYCYQISNYDLRNRCLAVVK